MLNKYISLIILILVMGFASATITKLEPIKLGTCINIPQIEYNSSYQNLTFILTPNKTLVNLYTYMTKNGFSYNYSFCNTNETGIYTVNGCSDLSCWNFEFEVTPTGLKQTGQRTTAITVAIISMFVVCILLFVAFLTFEHLTAKISFIVLSFIFLLVGINLILNSLVNEVVDSNVIALFDFISAASYYFYWLGAGILCIILFLTVFSTFLQNSIKNKREKYE